MDILLILRALRKNKVGAILIGLQIALTLAIVCNSLSIIQQSVAKMQRPSGVDEDNSFTLASTWLSDPTDLAAQIRGDLAAIRGLPGVVDAIDVVSFPLDGNSYNAGLSLKPDQASPTTFAAMYFTDEHGLSAFGFRLVAGRWFNANEVGLLRYYENKYPPTIVLTQELANTLFPQGNALGQTVYISPAQFTRVVGIIAHAQTPGAANALRPENSVFLPMLPMSKSTQYFVRTRSGQLNAVMRAAQDKLFAVDAHRIIQRVTPFSESRHMAYLLPRTLAIMLAVVSALLLAVTGFGVVGLTTYWVSQRRRQIGMRRALGARRVDILKYFHTENLLIVGVGCVLGIALGLAINTLMATAMQLTRMSAAYLGIGAVIVLAMCQLAVLWPALRASSIAPAAATRGL